ncbi:MAG: glycosyltransferase family 2 protein [Gammaproteobacteria bacterium]|nr:glycosyltransferase family 2 protein [Gammaproteobacteria bacterium]
MNAQANTDVLMITYNRPHYTRLALQALMERSDAAMRIWLWHNGDDAETLEVLNGYRDDLHAFHHSRENVGLREPTNWLFANATGNYLGKVDDDCIVPVDWGRKLRAAHESEPRFGVLGCWRFQPEDFVPELAQRKIQTFGRGQQLLVNLWVEGSGYLMKRACVDRLGALRRGVSFTNYCIQIGRLGWINGWVYPFIHQEHMDDPRSPNSALHTDADLNQFLPLSARRTGVTRLDQWLEQLRASALAAQTAPIDPGYWSPLRRRMRRVLARGRASLAR